MRSIVVGDVHGHLLELQALLSKALWSRTDRLIFVGDIVDKGPYVVETVQFIARAARRQQVVLVKGNHESSFLRRCESDTYQKMHFTLDPDEIRFLETAVCYYRIPEHNSLVVHAGIPPNLRQLPPESDVDEGLAQTFQQLRFVDDRGQPVRNANSAARFWAELYDGRFGHIYFGHHSFIDCARPVIFPNAVGLDLGITQTGRLAAALIDVDCVDYVVESSTKPDM